MYAKIDDPKTSAATPLSPTFSNNRRDIEIEQCIGNNSSIECIYLNAFIFNIADKSINLNNSINDY